MKKKLAMAAALLPNPDLLFLDEPFEGVDAVTSRVIRDLLAGFVARGSTVFLTSHVLEIVERLCTHVGIIVKGKLVEQASLATIRQGGSLEDCFLQKGGGRARSHAQAQLARGGDARELAALAGVRVAAVAAAASTSGGVPVPSMRADDDRDRRCTGDGDSAIHRLVS